MVNTWPSGKRHAMAQAKHEQWNAHNYPGTRQLCCACEQPTGCCEDDAIYYEEEGPFCETCYREHSMRKECHWRENNEGDWETDCGEIFCFIDGSPTGNNMNYCCYCGGSLTEHCEESAKLVGVEK